MTAGARAACGPPEVPERENYGVSGVRVVYWNQVLATRVSDVPASRVTRMPAPAAAQSRHPINKADLIVMIKPFELCRSIRLKYHITTFVSCNIIRRRCEQCGLSS